MNNDGHRADLRLHNLGENGEALAVDIVVPDPFAVSRIDRCLRETWNHLLVAGQGKARKHGHLFQWQRIVHREARGSYDNPLGKDLFFPWEMDHVGLTGYGAQTVLKMIADFAVKNNTFSQGQTWIHDNRWRQRLSCSLADVVGKSVHLQFYNYVVTQHARGHTRGEANCPTPRVSSDSAAATIDQVD